MKRSAQVIINQASPIQIWPHLILWILVAPDFRSGCAAKNYDLERFPVQICGLSGPFVASLGPRLAGCLGLHGSDCKTRLVRVHHQG